MTTSRSSVEAIRKMGAEKGFAVDVSDDPAVFTDANLKQYAALVFSNSNNEAFSSDAQRDAFKHYIESGGGFVGLHSASGSERDWPYFWSVLGGKFAAHPKMQPFTVQVADPAVPGGERAACDLSSGPTSATSLDHLNPDIHPVLVTDRTKLSYLEALKIDVSAVSRIRCRWPGITSSMAAASSTLRSATTRRTTQIPSSTASSRTASSGR